MSSPNLGSLASEFQVSMELDVLQPRLSLEEWTAEADRLLRHQYCLSLQAARVDLKQMHNYRIYHSEPQAFVEWLAKKYDFTPFSALRLVG